MLNFAKQQKFDYWHKSFVNASKIAIKKSDIGILAGISVLLASILMASRLTAATPIYDVIVYDSSSSGFAAVKALAETAAYKNTKVNVMWVKQNPGDKSMYLNGLNIEDYYWQPTLETGVVKQFRQLIDSYYGNSGRYAGYSPYRAEANRQTFINKAAKYAINQLLASPPLKTGATGIALFDSYGFPESYSYDSKTGLGTLKISNGSSFSAKYFIDASVEADLARTMGASYRLGMNETVFNDANGVKANYENVINCVNGIGYDGSAKCTPTPFTALLSLRKINSTNKSAQYKTDFSSTLYPNYNSEYFNQQFSGTDLMSASGEGKRTLTCEIEQMMKYPLPSRDIRGDWYEFNQHWNDYRIPEGIVDWYTKPEKRAELTAEIIAVAKEAVNYLNRTCKNYTDKNGRVLSGVNGFEIVETPTNPYIRGEMRIVGQNTMNGTLSRNLADSVGLSIYDPYDRRAGDHQVVTNRVLGGNTGYAVEISYFSLLPNVKQTQTAPGLKNLIVSTAISTDAKTYNTAIRMEATRMMMGEAAGTAVSLAKARGIYLNSLNYSEVQKELLRKGIALHW